MKKLGIIGGGQLGKMAVLEARKMDIHTTILTPEYPSPASEISNSYIIGGLYDREKIRELASQCDVITIEIEHVNIDALRELEDEGIEVYPSSKVIEVIQDKSKQKKLLDTNKLPTSRWSKITNTDSSYLENLIDSFGYPVVQKSCTGGYDGRGVFILKSKDDLKNMINGDSFLEEFIDCQMEIAVMVARNLNGEIKAYPVVEMAFDSKTNICDTVIAPARISEELQEEAKLLAIETVKALDGIGIYGVEMFLTNEGKLLINEVAPRPHNSGHYTIEACRTSQYEQFIRAVLNCGLGSTKLLAPSCMVNVLGEEGYDGEVLVEGMEEMLRGDSSTYLHLYGKKETKPYRKMGHITSLGSSVETALKKALDARERLKIKAKK